jgi:hypothetical protein
VKKKKLTRNILSTARHNRWFIGGMRVSNINSYIQLVAGV